MDAFHKWKPFNKWLLGFFPAILKVMTLPILPRFFKHIGILVFIS